MLRTTRNLSALFALCSALISATALASETDETPTEDSAFALMDLRGNTAWAIANFEWLEPSEDALETLITSAGKGAMRLDLAMDSIVPPYCELRPDPAICDDPGIPVSWMEDVPQTICMDIPADIRARHKKVLGTSDQLCLEPSANLVFPKDWVGGETWPQVHLHQTITPAKLRIEGSTAIIDVTVTDAIATPLATLSETGYGLAEIGMNEDKLRKALGPKLDQFIAGDDENCAYLQRALDPSGLGYLLLDDKLARVSLYADEYDVATSLVKTTNGISIGATKADIFAAFDGKTLVEDGHEYLGADARYITWWTDDAQTRGIRFELNEEGLVTAIHAGSDAITLVEGCS